MVVSYLAAIIVTLSQEQAGIALILVLFCLAAGAFHQRLLLRWHVLSLLAVATVGFVISIKAPGNIARLHAETATWLPDFYTAPLAGHLNDALRWMLEALINHSGLLLIILWASLAGLIFIRNKRLPIDYALITLFISVGILSISHGFEVLQYWTTFHATWHTEYSSIGASIMLVPWVVAIIATPLAVIRAIPDLAARLIVIALMLCGYGTTIMMTLTPTMYASSWRSMLIPSMLIGTAAFVTVVYLWRQASDRRFLVLPIVVLYSLTHYAIQLTRMIVQK